MIAALLFACAVDLETPKSIVTRVSPLGSHLRSHLESYRTFARVSGLRSQLVRLWSLQFQ